MGPSADLPPPGRPLPGVVVRVALPFDTTAARLARQAASAYCSSMPPPLVEAVVFCASELASNAVQHAVSPCELRLTIDADHRVYVEVRDGSTTLPRLTPLTLDTIALLADRGRGLGMIHALGARLGWGLVPGGKRVWAVLDPREVLADRDRRPR